MKGEKFWMLFAEGGHAPTVKHDSPELAKQEAERIARTTKRRVYMLEVVGSCMCSDVQWERAERPTDEDIPF